MTNDEIQRERNLLNHAFSNNQGIHHHFLNDCYHLQVELEEIRKQLYESKAKANMLQAENDSLRGVIQELQAINESVDPNLILEINVKKIMFLYLSLIMYTITIHILDQIEINVEKLEKLKKLKKIMILYLILIL